MRLFITLLVVYAAFAGGFLVGTAALGHAPTLRSADECACGNATIYRWRMYDGTWRCSDGVTTWNC